MSADRDYWTELKQLLRWFITPGLPPLVEIVQACPARPGSSGLVWARPGTSSLSGIVQANTGWSGLVRARPGSSGSFRLISVCLGSSGLVQALMYKH